MNDQIIKTSPYNVLDTVNKVEQLLMEHQVKVFARFKHSQLANELDMPLNDTEVIVFGSPKVGTFLMQENPDIALELPLKILCVSKENTTYMIYKDPKKLEQEYEIENSKEIIDKLSGFMDEIISKVIGGQA